MKLCIDNFLIWIHLGHEINHSNSKKIKNKKHLPSVFRGTLGKQCGPMNPHRAHTIFFCLFSSIFPPVGLIHTRGPPQSSRGPYPHHPSAPSSRSPPLSNPSAHALFSGGGDARSPAPSSSGCGARGARPPPPPAVARAGPGVTPLC